MAFSTAGLAKSSLDLTLGSVRLLEREKGMDSNVRCMMGEVGVEYMSGRFCESQLGCLHTGHWASKTTAGACGVEQRLAASLKLSPGG